MTNSLASQDPLSLRSGARCLQLDDEPTDPDDPPPPPLTPINRSPKENPGRPATSPIRATPKRPL